MNNHLTKNAGEANSASRFLLEKLNTKNMDSGLLLKKMKQLRYINVFPAYSEARIQEEELFSQRSREYGIQVDSFPIPCPGGWWPFHQLDAAWKNRERGLMEAYEKLTKLLQSKDVLINSGGAMIHPEFISGFKHLYKVYICGDDPERSDILSEPVAPYFNFCFPTNIAAVDLYHSWGCKNVNWLFMPVSPDLCDTELTEEKILNGVRDIDIALFCERGTYGFHERGKRIERLIQAFPRAIVRGRGWPGGFAPLDEMIRIYRRTKIGWNLHNSTGPANTRSTTLPAFGIMQICDNARYFGELFELDQEAVGFDTIEECIEKTNYYLAHDIKRREIAARGWKKVTTEYTLEKWWERILINIAPTCIEELGISDHTHSVGLNRNRGSLDEMKRAAVDFYARGEFKEAEKHLGQIIKLYPQDIDALVSLARIYYEQKNYSLALAYLQLAKSINPDDSDVLKGIEIIEMQMRS